MEYSTAPSIEPLTVSVSRAAEVTGLSEWTIRDLAWKGVIDSRRHGRRVLIVYASLQAYIAGLEEAA